MYAGGLSPLWIPRLRWLRASGDTPHARWILVVFLLLPVALLVGLATAEAQESGAVDLTADTVQRPSPVRISVGENVQVSASHGGRAHFEVVASAHPSKPGGLLAAGMMWRGMDEKYDIVVYRSANGGTSWEPTLTTDREEVVQDPTLAMRRDGAAYLAAWGSSGMSLYRSPDAGERWAPLEIEPLDRPWISVSAPRQTERGSLYLHGTGEPEGAGDSIDVTVHRIDDRSPEILSSEVLNLTRRDRKMLATGNSAVLSDGTFLFPYLVRLQDLGDYEARTNAPPRQRRHPNALLRVAVSTDGGASFTTETVARWYHRWGRGKSATFPRLAVDTTDGPFSGRVYIAWTDFRSGEGQVLLSHSDRPAKRWSDPVVVNRTGGPAFHPALAVNSDGILGISWYDRRATDGGLGWRARFAASRDGGHTVSRSTWVSEAPYRYAWDGGLVISGEPGRGEASAYLQFFNENGGHSAGLTADATGTFYPVWIDNRTGTPQMWTAPVEVEGEGRPLHAGTPALSGLQDVTRETVLRVEKAAYDDSSAVATLTLRLQNLSQDTLRGPIALKMIDLWSEFGTVEILGLEGAGRAHGTVRPVPLPNVDDHLAPRGKSEPIRIHARIEDPEDLGPMPPPPPGREVPGYALLQIRAQVMARRDSPAHP